MACVIIRGGNSETSLLSADPQHSPGEDFSIFCVMTKVEEKKRAHTQNLYPIAYGKLDKEHSKLNKLYIQGCLQFYYQPCLWASVVLFEAA